MAKLPRKVAIRYVGQKPQQEDTVSGAKAEGGGALYWRQGEVEFVTREQAALLLFYPSMWADARTEDDKEKHGVIVPRAPVDPRYAEQTEEELAEGRDVMPFVDVKKLDKQGLVTFAGTYLSKRLNIDDSLESLRDQVNRAVDGMRYEWA